MPERSHGRFHIVRETERYSLRPLERFSFVEQTVEVYVHRVAVRRVEGYVLAVSVA